MPASDFYPRPPRGGRRQDRRIYLQVLPISIHALREEGDVRHVPGQPAVPISIHALREEGDVLITLTRPIRGISIHALREEGDRERAFLFGFHCQFLSTPSARRATISAPSFCGYRTNFYPRPPRGGRPTPALSWQPLRTFLSTPSARRATWEPSLHANSRTLFLSTPSARRATLSPRPGLRLMQAFLSTPSARRATNQTARGLDNTHNFYPRPPRGGRLVS